MVVNKRKGYIIGITVGIIGCFLTWIIMGNSLLFKNPVPYVDVLWAILHAHLYVILLMINPQSYLEDVITYFFIFIQWFILGRFGWWLLKKFRSKTKDLV